MKNEVLLSLDWLFNLGVKSGLPRYGSLFLLLQISPLLILDEGWRLLGVSAVDHLHHFPRFVQEYVTGTHFQNSMLVFWILSPFTFLINSFLFLKHFNLAGYASYLSRRELRLMKIGKAQDYSLVIGCSIYILMYFWVTCTNPNNSSFLGEFTPMENRFSMMLIQGGSVALVLPAFITVIVVELRANLEHKKT